MKKISILLAILLIGVTLLTACSPSGGNSSGVGEDVRTIKVVGVASNIPFVYAGEDGVLQGYEIEVLKAVDELLPQYKFQYDVLDFAAMPQALEAQQAQIAVCMLVKSEERSQKFIFPDEYSTLSPIYGIIKEGRTDIQTIDDLGGKTLISSPTGYEYNVALKYNQAHPDNPIKFKFLTEANQDQSIPDIISGKADTMFLYKQSFEYIVKELQVTGLGLTPPLIVEDTYFMLGKQETQLRDDISGALRQLKSNGRLSELSKQILGEDVFEVYKDLFAAQGQIK